VEENQSYVLFKDEKMEKRMFQQKKRLKINEEIACGKLIRNNLDIRITKFE
jgi:hypothetical protein